MTFFAVRRQRKREPVYKHSLFNPETLHLSKCWRIELLPHRKKLCLCYKNQSLLCRDSIICNNYM